MMFLDKVERDRAICIATDLSDHLEGRDLEVSLISLLIVHPRPPGRHIGIDS